MDISKYQVPENQFTHLSLKDLLDARDEYHVHLMCHPHVTATAVGRYRIRNGDSWPNERGMGLVHHTGKRTLENSEVRPYSWPAIIVFVDSWMDAERFTGGRGSYSPSDMVPKTLYMPDGRRVPVCVVEAPKDLSVDPTPPSIRFPLDNIGGGYPVILEVQGKRHVATIACLVSDGHTVYALTNRHVTGEQGEVIYSYLDGRKKRIGTSAGKQLTRMLFSELYPGWAARDVYVNLDVGLMRIDNLDAWTAQVEASGTVAPMADLSVSNISLQLIGASVTGYGSASAKMEGEIHALFYRYKSEGGFEYVSDLFIGPRTSRTSPKPKRAKAGAPFATRPGDSGTLWLLEPVDDRSAGPSRNASGKGPVPSLPLAIQWGANIFDSGDRGSQSFALATFLSRACSVLEVDLIRDWNLDQPDTWGSIGHFSIAARTIDALSNRFPKLKRLMDNNRTIITHDDSTILTSDFKGMSLDKFVPLADVPDFFWKHGKQGHTRPLEGPNHFADMDQVSSRMDGTLLDLCKDPGFIDANKWNNFYDSVKDLLTNGPIAPQHRGLLPFRIWQIFDAMIEFAKKGAVEKFVCAAGVLTHYVGDACQPLHISYLHDGDPLQAASHTVHHRNGTIEDVRRPLGMGMHAAYEDEMINANRKQILAELKRTQKSSAAELVANGFEAAERTVELMRGTSRKVPPKKILKAFIDHGPSKKGRAEYMWRLFEKGTIEVMQDGTHLIAVLWESAWQQADGDGHIRATKAITQQKAMEICADPNFLPSMTVDQIGAQLKRP